MLKTYLYHFQLYTPLLLIMICAGSLSKYLPLVNTVEQFINHQVPDKYGAKRKDHYQGGILELIFLKIIEKST